MFPYIAEVCGITIPKRAVKSRERIRKTGTEVQFDGFKHLEEQISQARVKPADGHNVLKGCAGKEMLPASCERQSITRETVVVDTMENSFGPYLVREGKPPCLK